MSISVIIPAFNASGTIRAAILSVLQQESDLLECIVVDDCSVDGTAEIVREMKRFDDRVIYYRLPVNSGRPAGPRNHGIKHAKGRYIAFLDADDLFLPNKLKFQLNFMSSVGASISCTAYRVIDGQNSLIGVFHPLMVTSYDSLLKHNTIGCSTIMIDTSRVGCFNFPVCGHEDYALWLDLAKKGHNVHGLDLELSVYRIAGESVSSNKFKVLSFFWNIYRNLEKFSFIRSLYFCGRYAWNVRRKYR